MAFDLRPMTAAELLDRTFFLYRKHFTLFAGIIVIPMLAYFLASVLIESLELPNTVVNQLLKLALLVPISLLASLYAQGATVAAVSDVYLCRTAGIGKSFARLRGNLINILLATILMALTTGFGFLLIVPGIIFVAAFALTVPAVVIEKLNPIDAMRRSWNLTKQGRLRVWLVIIVVFVLLIIVSAICMIPAFVMTGISKLGDPSYTPSLVENITKEVCSLVASCLVGPLQTIALSLLYYDQRARKEGFDLQFMISSLEPDETGNF